MRPDVRDFMRMGTSFLLAMCKNSHAARILEINSTNVRFFITNTLSGEHARISFSPFTTLDAPDGRIKAFGGLRVVIDGKLVYPLEIVDSQIVARASTEIIPVNAGCARDDQIRFFIVSRFIYLIIVDNRNRNFSPVCMGFADLQVAVTDDLSFAGLLVWVSRVEIGRFFGRIDGVLP